MSYKAMKSAGLFAVAFVLGGCYHATINTGRPASGAVIEDKWADSFVEALVPPDAVETAQRCPAGIASVETRVSFLNMLVRGLTLGIYTPMHIKVMCAAEGDVEAAAESTIQLPAGSSAAEIEAAIQRAARLSAALDQPAYLALAAE